MEAMKAFHENYMPSSRIVNFAMKKLEKLDIRTIAPQHGSVIRENISAYIDTLKDLQCGDYLLEEGD